MSSLHLRRRRHTAGSSTVAFDGLVGMQAAGVLTTVMHAASAQGRGGRVIHLAMSSLPRLCMRLAFKLATEDISPHLPSLSMRVWNSEIISNAFSGPCPYRSSMSASGDARDCMMEATERHPAFGWPSQCEMRLLLLQHKVRRMWPSDGAKGVAWCLLSPADPVCMHARQPRHLHQQSQSPDTTRPFISGTCTAAEMTLPQLLHCPSSMRRRSTE